MTRELQVRLLVAAVLSVPLGFGLMRRTKMRLDEWTQNPATEQQRLLERMRKVASGRAFIGAAIICVGVTIFVEMFTSFILGPR